MGETNERVDSIIFNPEFDQLLEFNLTLNSTLDINKIMRSCARAITNMLDGEGCHILFSEETTDHLKDLNANSFYGDNPFFLKIDETEGFSRQTLVTGETALIQDVEKGPEVTRKLYEKVNCRSFVSVPIIVTGKVIGVISVYSSLSNKFTKRHGELLSMLGNYLGLTVENACLMLKLKDSPPIDPLTKVFNKLYFADKIHFLLNSKNEPITLTVLVLNNLKEINRTYGYTTGDFVLREVASVLRESVRECDILTRYGGDEFVTILASTEETFQLAKQIENKVKNHVYIFKENPIQVSLTWGTATIVGKCIAKESEIFSIIEKKIESMKH